MLAHADNHVQIARCRRLASRHCPCRRCVCAGRRGCRPLRGPPAALRAPLRPRRGRLGTGGCTLPRAAAARAGDVELHSAAGLRDVAAAVALRAGCGRAHHAAAVAVGAGIQARDVQAHHRAADRVPEADIDLVFQIRAAFWSGFRGSAAAPSAAKDAGKNIARKPPAHRLTAHRRRRRSEKSKPLKVKPLAASAARRRGSKTARAKAAAARIGLRCRGIDIV